MIADVEKRLKEYRKRINAIKARTASVDSRQKLEFETQLDLLYAKQQLAEEKAHALARSSDQNEREAVKVSLDGICAEIENAIDSAWAKLNL